MVRSLLNLRADPASWQLETRGFWGLGARGSTLYYP